MSTKTRYVSLTPGTTLVVRVKDKVAVVVKVIDTGSLVYPLDVQQFYTHVMAEE